MNAAEFQKWYAEFKTAFPGIHTWIVEKSPDPAGTLKTWQRTLATVPLAAAATVLDRMVTGVLRPPQGYERDQAALIVRSYALALMSRQRGAQQVSAERQLLDDRRTNNFPAGRQYRKAAALMEKCIENAAGDREKAKELYNDRYREEFADFIEGRPCH